MHSPAIDSFLAGNDSNILRYQATRSSLPQITAPAESRRAGTSLLVSLSTLGSSTGGCLPGLSQGESVRSSESISSSLGVNEIFERVRTLVEESPDGPLILPRPLVAEPIFECPFNFLQCYRSFTDEAEWFEHSLTHFGNVGPPSLNECPFCDRHYGQFKSSIPMESWKFRMMLVSWHLRNGATVATARPDFFLINYLWENNLITPVQYRNVRCQSESQTAPYTVTESRRSRRRQR